jgi:hypothetical protein
VELVCFQEQVVAVVGRARVRLVPPVERLSVGHPVRRFVVAMALYGWDVERGVLPGPYSDRRAAWYARSVLIDNRLFRAHRYHRDLSLARMFVVPVAQVAAKRADLGLVPRRRARGRARCRVCRSR